jgi:hypothetical protein
MSTIKTPELAEAANALSRLIKAADQGAANVDQGRLLVSATNGQCRVIKTDLDRRLSDGKLREMEAKDITGQVTEVPSIDHATITAAQNKSDAVALLRAAASLLEQEQARGERSGGEQNAGRPSALAGDGNDHRAAA